MVLSFEIVPYEDKTLYLVDFVELTHENQPYRRAIFDDLKDTKDFIDAYLEHFALFMAKCPEPEGGWIWSHVPTNVVQKL